MDFTVYKGLVDQLKLGKRLSDAVYLHRDSIELISSELQDECRRVEQTFASDFNWDVVKFFRRDHKLSFLAYPSFFKESYPALKSSLTIDISRGSSRVINYTDSNNPPILHRKETFISEDHPHYVEACEITKEGEAIGLYENARKIGFKKSWERLIADKGHRLVGGRLVPKHQADATSEETEDSIKIKRHRTAINRDKLSAPMQSLARHGFLDGNRSVFDYGCGKGDDLLELEAHGINAAGWDPVFRATTKREQADIVNLGFVINVIEERDERVNVLKAAYKLANSLLVVAVMLGRESVESQFKPYKDGVVTSRDTFQKYFTQAELREFVESATEQHAHAVGPGIYFIFKDELEEQLFLSNRQRVNRQWRQLTTRAPKGKVTKAADIEKILRDEPQLVEAFWNTCLDLGRLPANDEFELSADIRKQFGSHKSAYEALSAHFDQSEFETARTGRVEDLLVYFALSFFSQRKAYSAMPRSIQRDIKAFFKSITQANDYAKKSLFSIANTDAITEACFSAQEDLETGRLESDHSYVLHRNQLSRLPGILRIYVGCATAFYGDIDDVDLIKIHMQSGKVSLMIYDDYENTLPILQQRIKINLRTQKIDWFMYNETGERQPLYLKSIYMSEDHPKYAEQQAFDKALLSVPGIDLSDYGPDYQELQDILRAHNLNLDALVLSDSHASA